MPPTLVDIARETNTSVSTVSRVLAGGVIANRISKETRERVQLAATRLGYRPNLIARTLRTRRSNTIALLVSDIANPFYAQIGSLIEQTLHKHGYSLMLCNSGESAAREVEYLQLLNQKAIDGLILVPITLSRDHIQDHISPKMPLVILDRPITGIETTVATDQDQSAHVLCEALKRAGVKRVALVTGPMHVSTHNRRCEIVSQSFEIVAKHEGPAQRDTGKHAVPAITASTGGVLPDAIICTNNFLAQGVIESLVHIDNPPVIGVFDEIPMMHVLPTPIVCSVQDINALAEGCAHQLLALLAPGENQKKIAPLIIPARAVSNRAFQKWEYTKAGNRASVPEPETAEAGGPH